MEQTTLELMFVQSSWRTVSTCTFPVLSYIAKVAEAVETLLTFTLIEVCIKECAAYKFSFKFLRSQPTYADILTYVWNTWGTYSTVNKYCMYKQLIHYISHAVLY